jgi:hypothetical protein
MEGTSDIEWRRSNNTAGIEREVEGIGVTLHINRDTLYDTEPFPMDCSPTNSNSWHLSHLFFNVRFDNVSFFTASHRLGDPQIVPSLSPTSAPAVQPNRPIHFL